MTAPRDTSPDHETFLRLARLAHNIILMGQIGLCLWLAADILKHWGTC
ncbi:MAG: hypothetical protein AB7E05_09240 [Sphingobium sp.]